MLMERCNFCEKWKEKISSQKAPKKMVHYDDTLKS
jgi:hypothetical protein